MSNERTEKQKQASRENGKKSQGPVKDERKERVKYNALKHGLCSKTTDPNGLLLSDEDPEKFQEFRDAFYQEWRPDDITEADMLDQYIAARWKLKRHRFLETSTIETDRYQRVFEYFMSEAEYQDKGITEALSINLGKVMLLKRYETATDRESRQCLRELRSLQKDRKLQNEPENVPTPPTGPPPGPPDPVAETERESDLPQPEEIAQEETVKSGLPEIQPPLSAGSAMEIPTAENTENYETNPGDPQGEPPMDTTLWVQGGNFKKPSPDIRRYLAEKFRHKHR